MKPLGTRVTVLTLALVVLLGIAACAPARDVSSEDGEPQAGQQTEEPIVEQPVTDDDQTPGQSQAFTSTALVVSADEGLCLFVDQETETPYFPTLPDDAPELAVGNVVRVTGNGIMLESYPAQYPGITAVEVLEEGTPEDADEYQSIVNQIRVPRDPAAPASAAIEYRTELALVTLTPLTSGYEWSYGPAETLKTLTKEAPELSSYATDDLPSAALAEPTEVTMVFDVEPMGASVTSWSENDPDGVSVVSISLDNEQVSFTAEPGVRYAAQIIFENGTVTYAFAA